MSKVACLSVLHPAVSRFPGLSMGSSRIDFGSKDTRSFGVGQIGIFLDLLGNRVVSH